MNALDLGSLLADASQGGAYFVAESDTAAITEAGAALGYVMARVDLAGCVDVSTLFARFARALRFPEWFGHNWDALADSLGDLSWLPGSGYVLLIENASGWRAAAGDDAAILLAILNDAAATWAAQGVAFWALLPLPAVELDALDPHA